MKAIWKRELQSYFYTPVGYVFVGVFLLVSSILFFLTILQQHSGDLPTFIGQMSYLWMLLSPVLTMRLLAEERQRKTDQLLLTSPVSLTGIVTGKFLAAATVLLATAGLTLVYAAVVGVYGQVFPGELTVNYLGFILQGCAFTAMDMYLSGCAATPVSAAVLGFGANFLLWMIDMLRDQISVKWIAEGLAFLSLYNRNEAFLMGQMSPAGMIYEISFTILFLAMTVYHLENRRNPLGGGGQDGRWKRCGIRTGILVFMIAALAAVNICMTTLEKDKGWRMDYSFNGITTQSETTREVLKELKDPVHIYALFPKGQEDAPLMELLDRYAAASPLITWEQSDPGLNPALVTRFSTKTESVTGDSLIVYCEKTGRWRILSPAEFISLSMDPETGTYSYAGYTYERAITSALVYVTREEIPRITIIQGHGELDGETLQAFTDLMTRNHYEVIFRNLAESEYEPDPAELIAFFSPMRDISEVEMEKLQRFTEAGGCMLITCDYSDPVGEMPNYRSLLRSYGFLPREGIVVAEAEDSSHYYNNIRIDLIPEMLSTDVTMDLVASGANTVLMPGSRAFETPGGTDRNLMVFPVLQSGEKAYLKQLSPDMTSIEKTAGDPSGPFTLALQAQRVTAGGYVSRAFLCGSSGMMTEEQIYAMTDAQQLILRMTEHLTGQSGSNLEIMGKSAVRPALSARGNGMGSVIVTVMPLAVLMAAAIVLLRRKNR
ncbi:MAG: Gldg family protein [Clostridia bacterium]|nr:Gldg family protein [Clostridia bacterium]